MPGRCLIIANQTLGGDALDTAVKDCLRRDIRRFFVVVPVTPVEFEASSWSGGFAVGDLAPAEIPPSAMDHDARRFEAEIEEAHQRAQRRLDLMIEKVRTNGGEAKGVVGTSDPLEATRAVLDEQDDIAEVIVSTLPAGLSRWLKMDLPSRIIRLVDVPVTTIEADA